MNRTKIVCTLGPSTDDDNVLREMMKSGMNVARQNFSHGTHESHLKTFERVKRLREELGLPIASLLDTKGPEVRVKQFVEGKVQLVEKEDFILTTADCEGTKERVSVTHKGLQNDVERGDRILIDDGMIELKVSDIVPCDGGADIITTVVTGGILSNNKSCNLPGKKLSLPYVSEVDRNDLIFGCQTGYDFVAASFVSCADDILQVRKILSENGGKSIKIIAKIENQDGIDNIDDIIRVSDGIMVARGDMGVEIPFEDIPRIQKMLIKKGYTAGKQVITATQMLESMTKNPRPTRAETTDVANAIYDGTSAIMLSGETAAGAYPLEAVKTMAKIAKITEENIEYAERFRHREGDRDIDVTNAIAHAAVTTAIDLNAKAMLAITYSGGTSRLLSKFRPPQPIIACTPNLQTCRQMGQSWGVIPVLTEEVTTNTTDLINLSINAAVRDGLLENGDLVVVTAGVPIGIAGTTNLMKVQVVGDILVSGEGIGEQVAIAPLCVVSSNEEARKRFCKGDILVIPATDNSILDLLKTAAGIVTEEDKETSHAAIVGLTLDIPVIVNAKNATKILKSGITVTIDAAKGLVQSKDSNNSSAN